MAACVFELLSSFAGAYTEFQHDDPDAHVVSRRTQSGFGSGHTGTAALHQNAHGALVQLGVGHDGVDHQVLVDVTEPGHHGGTEHVQHHLLRGTGFEPCGAGEDFGTNFGGDDD